MRRLILEKATVNHQAIGSRRWLLAATAVFGLAAVACQDGPNQTYSPPPANANWNDGRAWPGDGGVPVVPAGTATSSSAPFALPDGGAITSGGNNASEICTQQQIAAVTPLLANAAIIPPNQAANLNLAGSDGDGGITWQGLTANQAEQINCQGTVISDVFGDGEDYLDIYWDNEAVLVQYYTPTQKIDQITISAGYGGTMDFTSLDGTVAYSMPVDGVTPISAVTTPAGGGQPITSTISFDWVDAANGVPSAVKVFDTLYRAIMATFFATYPTEPANLTCNQTGACIIGLFPSEQVGYFYIPALDLSLYAGPYTAPATANPISQVNLNFAQVMNYSPANPVLKLDATGPTTIPLQLAAAPTPPCQLTMGMSYGDFINNCVTTSPSAGANTSELLELFSDYSHDEETFQFNISGVDMSFADTRLGPTQVVVDPPTNGGCGDNVSSPACPQAQDTSFEFTADQSTLGLLANDWVYQNGVPVLQDLHGMGALYDDFRAVTIADVESELCANVVVPPPPADAGPAGDGGSDAGTSSGSSGDPISPVTPLQAQCAAWQGETLAAQIQGCVAPRDASGGLTGDPTLFQGVNCTGMETLVSPDITTADDPVNVGPIATQINPTYTLGMKMGHQQGSFCSDSMSRNQIAAESFTITCPGGAASCAPPTPSNPFIQLCPGGAGNCLVPGPAGSPPPVFSCPTGVCDPTLGGCAPGAPTCTPQVGTNPVPLTVAQIDYIGEVGIGVFLQNPTNSATPQPLPAGTEVVLALPYVCSVNNLLTQAYINVLETIGGGVDANLPIDIQGGTGQSPSPRFFFKTYGLSLIQTLEATLPDGSLSAAVSAWGPPTLGSLMPVRENDLFFDSLGAGQFESFEYVDRRFVCPDGANNCAPAGSTGFTCPTKSCPVNSPSCTAGPTCTASEFAQPPLDISFISDVKDGIMNSYDFNRYMYRGETALYQMIQPDGYATAQASNALMSNMFGSPLITNAVGNLAAVPPSLLFDLTGEPINPADYTGTLTPTSLGLSYIQADSPISIAATFPGAAQAQVTYPNGNSNTGASQALVPWIPSQPGNGFDEAQFGNSELDSFVQASSIDFSGITTTALIDYNVTTGMDLLAAESQDFLGDVFMCVEPAANPPILAVRMYTPTQAVLNWLNSVPSSYSDCGIVVRWSPYDNYINLIESTLYGVRLQVTQGGGLGRVVGVTSYVPNVPFEE